jgi:hypothetical protein
LSVLKLNVVMLKIIMLSGIMLSVVMLSVIKVYVVAPKQATVRALSLPYSKNTSAYFDEIEKQGIMKGEVSLYC